MSEEFLREIRVAKEKAKKRNFVQTWDLAIGLKNIDLRKPENRLNTEFSLPEGRGKDVKVIFIVDTLLPEVKKMNIPNLTKSDIEKLGKDKKKLKNLAKEYDWWFCEAPLMPLVGKHLGVVLGPRGKMPRPVPPKGSIKPFLELAKKLVRIRLKDSPVIHVPVGTENMKDEQIMKNVIAVINFVREKLPKGRQNLKNAHIKLTMGPAVKLKLDVIR
ncbi:MAG: 50S ribosomal protein L1 [Candidatus Aenigmarchaeota archaeon]|nr:50S ribosomal protein L1 [Candidatus Aenigmarchaeota archaeon]